MKIKFKNRMKIKWKKSNETQMKIKWNSNKNQMKMKRKQWKFMNTMTAKVKSHRHVFVANSKLCFDCTFVKEKKSLTGTHDAGLCETSVFPWSIKGIQVIFYLHESYFYHLPKQRLICLKINLLFGYDFTTNLYGNESRKTKDVKIQTIRRNIQLCKLRLFWTNNRL